MLIKGGGGEWDMCVLDCRCVCGSTVGVWRRAVGPAAIRLLLCGLAEGRSGRSEHEGVEGRVWGNRGAIKGNREGRLERTEGAIRGTEKGEREKTEGRERRNRGTIRENRGTEEEEQRGWKREGWDVLRAVWGEVGGHGVMVRGCDGAVDTAAVWFPVV